MSFSEAKVEDESLDSAQPGADGLDAIPVSCATRRERFLNACRCRPLDHPPVWLMRQAGRVLPEYRDLKRKYSFLELVRTPELAAEVTLQPIQRFGFDAAIVFSDILVVPEALGQGYSFREQGGIQMDFTLKSSKDIDRLDPTGLRERLDYIAQSLCLIRQELQDQTALIGFAGSPWTLANFMLEGGSVREFTRARQLFYSERATFERLMEVLTEAVTIALRLQLESGADAIQIFDSLGGLLSEDTFQAASGRWIQRIIEKLASSAPCIVFSKGAHNNWDCLVETGAQVLSVDWTVNLARVRRQLPPNMGVQGNLDPTLLETKPEIVSRETERILTEMRGHTGHIFNLGHGVPPTAKLENIEALVQTIRSFK